MREVLVDCISEPGEGLVKVWGPGGSEGLYSLSIYEGVGRCGVSCEPDAYDLEQAEDDEPIDIDLPFDEQLSLCPNDQDYFSFRVERGVAYSLNLSPDVADAPIEYVLYRGELLIERRAVTPGRTFEFIAENDGEYRLLVYSANLNFSGHYRLNIQRSGLGRCDDATPCPAGTRCEDNVCVGRPCHGADQCRNGEECVVDRYALHIEAGLGACFPSCDSDRDCGGGQATLQTAGSWARGLSSERESRHRKQLL